LKNKTRLAASKLMIVRRTIIHTLFLAVGVLFRVYLGIWANQSNYTRLVHNDPDFQSFWQYIFQTPTFLVFFPLFILAIIFSATYASFDSVNYHT